MEKFLLDVTFPVYYSVAAAAAAKSLQSCPTLCDPIDGSPPGSPVPGILQARTLGWVAISFSNAWKWKVKVKLLTRVRLLVTPWTVAHQAPPSMGFSRQEYWSGVPLSSLVYYSGIITKAPLALPPPTSQLQGWTLSCSSSNSVIRSNDPEEKVLPCVLATLCFPRFRLLLQDECLSHFLTGLVNGASNLVWAPTRTAQVSIRAFTSPGQAGGTWQQCS